MSEGTFSDIAAHVILYERVPGLISDNAKFLINTGHKL